MVDHISVYHKQNKTIFARDAPGMHWFLVCYVCNANSIFWNEKDYLESIKKIGSLDLEYLCIAHFGVFTGEDISNFLDKSVSMYYDWMKLFDQHMNKLDDINFLLDELWNTIYRDFFHIPVLKQSLEHSLLYALNYFKNLKQL